MSSVNKGQILQLLFEHLIYLNFSRLGVRNSCTKIELRLHCIVFKTIKFKFLINSTLEIELKAELNDESIFLRFKS